MGEKGGLNFLLPYYLEVKKVKLVVIKFMDYILIWWDKNANSKRSGEMSVASWDEMKVLMRR